MELKPTPAGLRAILYDAEGRDRALEIAEIEYDSMTDSQLLWIDGPVDAFNSSVELPEQIRQAMGEILQNGPTIRIGGDLYWFTVPACPDRKTEAGTFVSFIVCGKSVLVTVRQTEADAFNRFIDTDRGETLKGQLSASSLSAALMMSHLGDFQRQISLIDDEVDSLDDAILRSREKGDPLRKLATLRRRLAALRRALEGHRSVMQSLERADFAPMIEDADERHFDNLYALYQRLEDEVARGRDAVVASFDIYATRVAQDTNELLRVLTIVTVVLGIVGTIAGVFGMNFEISFLPGDQLGFLIVVAMMMALSLLFLAYGRLRKWY